MEGTGVLHTEIFYRINDKMEPRWHFISALSPEAHAEWGLYTILQYMGLHVILPPGEGQNRTKLKKDMKNITWPTILTSKRETKKPSSPSYQMGQKSPTKAWENTMYTPKLRGHHRTT